jgi:hypothetical protein
MNNNMNKQILDAEIINEELNTETSEPTITTDTKTLFKVLFKSSGEDASSAFFDYVEPHSFNSELVVAMIHLILNSYCSMVPEDERESFALDVVQKFIESLSGKQEDQEDDNFIPDQPEHDGN